MTEADTIHPDYLPLTIDSLAAQLAACGLCPGQTVVVHSSMSKLGWIAGGEEAVIRALLRVLTPDGTLMMPALTTGNTDPSSWRHPPVPEHWWPIIREHLPPFDPATTPTREVGRIAELFRTWPGAKRSHHPIGSFAALGAKAHYLTCTHPLEGEFGEESPLGKLYQLDGCVLLIGVGHGNNTSLHLAEQRAQWPSKRMQREGTALIVNGVRQWMEYDTLVLDSNDFPQIGDSYEAKFNLPRGRVGRAEVRFMKQRPLVDFAVKWIERNRK